MKCFSLNLNVFKDLHFFRDDSKEVSPADELWN